MSPATTDDIERQRQRNRRYHSEMAKSTGLCFAFTAAMAALSYSGHADLKKVTEAERTDAMQTCMISVASRQIREQTTLARNGAIVVVDGGNPAVEKCIEDRLNDGEPTARRNSAALLGSLVGGISTIGGIAWLAGGLRRRRELNEKIRDAAPRP